MPLREQTHSRRLWPSKKFFAAKWNEQIERHRRFDDTAYNLEPNIKEGPGGLRDIQMIASVTQRHFDTTPLHDLVRHGFLSEPEYRTLVRGRNFPWKVRAGLLILPSGARTDCCSTTSVLWRRSSGSTSGAADSPWSGS